MGNKSKKERKNKYLFNTKVLVFVGVFVLNTAFSQEAKMPEILVNKKVIKENYLPDFSFAGYHFGEKETPKQYDHYLNVTDFGAKPNDDIDDSKAFIDAVKKADELEGYVVINIPSGKFNISKIIYINRSKTVLRGVGAGEKGTVLYFQRSLRFVQDPPEHEELMAYLSVFDKKQREPQNGVDNTFSQYSWSGAFIWVAKKGKFYKSYNIPKYNQPITTYAKGLSGKQGDFKIQVDDASKVKVGETYKLCWFNKDGKEGSFLKHLYDNQNIEIGKHHWDNPESPLVTQMVLVTKIDKNTVYIKAPLLHDIKTDWHCAITEWEHIEEVGIENIAFEFPLYPDLPHHLEEGNNAIYLTSLMNGWVKNVRFKNADSGILTDDISNVTIQDVITYGDKLAHYSVSMGEVHNVLVENLYIKNKVRHPLSFNTRSTKCVYTNCTIEQQPILDQHSGANQQNLFDNIKVYIDAPVHETLKYPLFKSGGSKFWHPAHGAFSTMFNIDINFANIPESLNKPILLNGIINGISARLIGFHANHPIKIDYTPNAYIENQNQILTINSLYNYQLQNRLVNQ